MPANYMAIVENRRLLFEILNRPNFAGAGYVNTACDFGIICAGHVYVVTVFVEVISWALVPHHLQATFHDVGLGSPTGTLVLGPSPLLTNVISEPGMGPVG